MAVGWFWPLGSCMLYSQYKLLHPSLKLIYLQYLDSEIQRERVSKISHRVSLEEILP